MFSIALLSVSETILRPSCPSTRMIAIVSCQFYANGNILGPLLGL